MTDQVFTARLVEFDARLNQLGVAYPSKAGHEPSGIGAALAIASS